MTFYPHTADNSHAGFVVYPSPPSNSVRQNWALIYAKKAAFLSGNEQFLRLVSESFEIHATIADLNQTGRVLIGQTTIINHGWMEPDKYTELIHQCKIMLGMGFPYEGPTPLEAIANGLVFVNPKFNPPRGRKLTDKREKRADILQGSNFFLQKPTFRLLSSQVPFLEQFSSQRTIDYSDEAEVRRTISLLATGLTYFNAASLGIYSLEILGQIFIGIFTIFTL